VDGKNEAIIYKEMGNADTELLKNWNGPTAFSSKFKLNPPISISILLLPNLLFPSLPPALRGLRNQFFYSRIWNDISVQIYYPSLHKHRQYFTPFFKLSVA
jgi:hypothetical protein